MQKYFVLLAFCCSLSIYSQTISIKGKILDGKTQIPLEAATVYLSSVADSTVIDYTITNKNGIFVMNPRKITKAVFLQVSYVGYQNLKQEIRSISESMDLGILRLEESQNTLGEVIVKSEAPPIRIKKDTLEFNASSFKVRPDSNVETLLRQLPGVEISTEGKITVNGKEVNQVLVNGKPFFDKDGKIALQSLPSEIINKVQISDTKTKKEELTDQAASSNNASINLTIDEDKNKGLFGKFMAGYGTDKRYETSGLINYFKNKRKISVLASSNNINSTGFSMDEIFDNMGGGRNVSYYYNPDDGSYGIGSLRFGGGKGIIRSNMIGVNYADDWFKNFETNGSYFFSSSNADNVNRTKQVNLLPTGEFTTVSNAVTSDGNSLHNFSYEFEFKIDSTTAFTVSPKFVTSKADSRENSNQSSYDNNVLLNDNTSEILNSIDKTQFTNTINFTKSFRRKGKYLNVMLENINTNEKGSGLDKSVTRFFQSDDVDDVRDQTRKINNVKDSYATEIEFAHPVKDSLNLKLGVYARWENNIDDKNTFDFNQILGSYSDMNEALSNEYGSTLKLITPKSGFSIQKNKFNFDLSIGTTITEMHSTSLYFGNKTALDNTYIFPYISSYANYRFGKSKGLWINYEYLAAFPTAMQLLPVENLADPLNTYIGNPNLDEDDGHRVNLNFNDYDYATRSGYYIYIGGQYYNRQIASTTVFDNSGKRTTTYDNVADTYATYYGSNWNKSIKRDANTFKFGIGLNAGLSRSKGFTDGNLYIANSTQLTPRINFTYEYGELLTINPTYNLTYNQTDYKNYLIDGASNVLHKFNLQTTNYWPKNWIFGNDFGYTYNSNIADGFKKDFYLLNSSLSYIFFNKKMTAKVKVYDVLNQNQSTTRTITPTTIRDEENIVLKRYMMFSLTYKIEKFAGKKKEENDFE